MPKKTSTQREAERLAQFLVLEPSQVDEFRDRNPRFAPKSWWDYQATNSEGKPLSSWKQWQFVQAVLQEAWDDGFELDLFEVTRLLVCVFDPGKTPMVGDRERLPFADLFDLADDWGFHIGVRYLAEHPWAAKVCKECKHPYVADHAKRKYCFEMGTDGLHCSERVIARDHLKWWHTKGDKKRRENRELKRKAAKKKTEQ